MAWKERTHVFDTQITLERAFNEIAELDFDHGIEAARAMRVAFMGSPELRQGIQRFLDKSAPKAKG